MRVHAGQGQRPMSGSHGITETLPLAARYWSAHVPAHTPSPPDGQMYDLYKPFRNYMRRFPLAESLQNIWLFAGHLSGQGPHANPLMFQDRVGSPVKLREWIYPWDLDLLAREVILNSPGTGDKSFSKWSDLTHAINFIREIDNEITRRRGGDFNVLLELHRLVHRQFPWQRPPSASSIMRYLKIFGGSELEPAVEQQTGLPIRKFYQLSFAVSGHFIKSPSMSTAIDYSVLDISLDKSQAFFRRLTASLPALRERTLTLQTYDDRWLYAWNPLQATPLVSVDPSHPDRVICPIPMFLLRRASDGLFYDLVNSLGFDNAYGSAFQNYVGVVLRELLKTPRFRVAAEEPYQLAKGYRKHGVDWTVGDETANIFIECKTKRLRLDAKFVVTGTGLADAMDALGSYIVQHYKNIIDALAGRTKWTPNDKPSFAIIVTLEDWWIFTPPIVKMLDESVSRRLSDEAIDKSILERVPYVVASIDELEIGCQILAETGIQPLLGVKTDPEYRGWALSPFAITRFPEQAKKAHRRLFADEFLGFGSGLSAGLDTQAGER